ncbi:hypothetical protein [Streptomyces chrestomyceticus]|uniref:Uncharacterized protein n=1 Tax=Streptomyces chrestomyceticus TaxID=68185 RepID=A0ABU7X331_9ACTN
MSRQQKIAGTMSNSRLLVADFDVIGFLKQLTAALQEWTFRGGAGTKAPSAGRELPRRPRA